MNKKLLCTAVGTAVGLGLGLPAQADEFNLIPYVVKDANRTTVVTVIANGTPSNGAQFHLQYYTKSTTDANTAACLPNSVTIPMTENDIMTFDTAGILGYPLFGDTTNPAPNGASISYAAPRHGYLVLQNMDDNDNWIKRSFWLELDLANGGAHGDKGLGAGDMSQGSRSDDNFSDISGNGSIEPREPPNIDKASPVAFWPSSIATQVFTVTPLGQDMLTKENNSVTLQVFNDNEVQGAYDRNENGVDGSVPVTVRCVGRVTPAQLMPGVVANAAWAAQGGWGYLQNLGANDTNPGTVASRDFRVTVYQVDTSSAGGKFMSNAMNLSSTSNR